MFALWASRDAEVRFSAGIYSAERTLAMFAFAALHGTLRSVTHLSRSLSAKGVAGVRATSKPWRRAALLVFALLMATLFVGNRLSGDVPPPPPNIPPSIADFVGSERDGYWQFSGRVVDENPVGMVVTFGGVISGHQVTVNSANGYFVCAASPQMSGMATAQTVDNCGQSSGSVSWYVILGE
jgi:hypothetical protein